MVNKKHILRIIDVNLNRSREGLRVCEEVARFILNNKALTKDLKNIRHRIQNIYGAFPQGWKAIVGARDSQADIGRHPSLIEMNRKNIKDVFFSNMQRSKESVRVLEEFLKLIDSKLSNRFKRLRFDLYEIEKKVLKEF